jgi:hypothetical protein
MVVVSQSRIRLAAAMMVEVADCYKALLKSSMYPPLVRAAFKPGARPVELDSDPV